MLIALFLIFIFASLKGIIQHFQGITIDKVGLLLYLMYFISQFL